MSTLLVLFRFTESVDLVDERLNVRRGRAGRTTAVDLDDLDGHRRAARVLLNTVL